MPDSRSSSVSKDTQNLLLTLGATACAAVPSIAAAAAGSDPITVALSALATAGGNILAGALGNSLYDELTDKVEPEPLVTNLHLRSVMEQAVVQVILDEQALHPTGPIHHQLQSLAETSGRSSSITPDGRSSLPD